MHTRWLCGALLAAAVGLTGCTSSHQPATANAATTSPLVTLTGVPAPSACTRALQARTVTFSAGGVTRSAAIALPAQDGRRHPLIVAFHGYDESVADFDSYTNLRHVASTRGAVVAEPVGLGSPVGWNVPDSSALGPSDVLMTRALINLLIANACVDPHRIALAGISDGADMAVTASCSAPGTAEALLLVAASTGPAPACHAITVLQVHGTKDPIDAYTGRGPDTRRGFGSVKAAGAERAFALWSQLARCTTHTDTRSGDLRRLTGAGCAHPVQLIAVQGGGHTWPGAAPRPKYGATTTSLTTNDLVRDVLAALRAGA